MLQVGRLCPVSYGFIEFFEHTFVGWLEAFLVTVILSSIKATFTHPSMHYFMQRILVPGLLVACKRCLKLFMARLVTFCRGKNKEGPAQTERGRYIIK